MRELSTLSYPEFIEQACFQLKEHTLNIIKFVDLCKSTMYLKYGTHYESYLELALKDEKLFKFLFDNHLLSQHSLKHLWNKIDSLYELESLSTNTYLTIQLLSYQAVSFTEFIDKYIKVLNILYLINDLKLFETLKNNHLLDQKDLSYFLNKIDMFYDWHIIFRNQSLVLYCLKYNLISNKMFESFLDSLSSVAELESLFKDSNILKHIIDNNLLTLERISKLTEVLRKDMICIQNNTYDLFEYLYICNKDYKEFKKLLYRDAPNSLELLMEFLSQLNFSKLASS